MDSTDFFEIELAYSIEGKFNLRRPSSVVIHLCENIKGTPDGLEIPLLIDGKRHVFKISGRTVNELHLWWDEIHKKWALSLSPPSSNGHAWLAGNANPNDRVSFGTGPEYM